ncbi:MAG: hypothetical protein J7L71_08535, partial [Spirochaetaceae bacterium]|nr:hypothetical protein [Spirochaetaceae bacterium]
TIPSTISLSNLVRATSGQGKVSFPVNSSDIAYANFKNIKIVPSSSTSGSYSVSRLQALDNLIEQLNKLRGREKVETPESGELNQETLKSLITKLSVEMHSKLDSGSVYKNPVKSTGLLFNFLV